MAIAHRASASANASGTTLTITKPAGTVSGDVLVAFLNTTSSSPTAPSGWTLVTSSLLGDFIYLKVAGGSEPASYAWTSGSVTWSGGISCFSGVDNSTPWDVSPTINTFSTSASVTTLTANAMLVGGNSANAAGNITPPAGFTEWWESGGSSHAEMAGALQAVAGASGTKTWTNSGAQSAWLGSLRDATITSPPQTITITGIASAQAVGTPSLSLAVVPSGITSAEALGTPALTVGAVTVSPPGIGSSEAVGVPSIVTGNQIAAVGVASAQAFGVPTITGALITVSVPSIGSAEAFGVPSVRNDTEPQDLIFTWIVGQRSRAIRFVFETTEPSARFRVREFEVWHRPSGRQ